MYASKSIKKLHKVFYVRAMFYAFEGLVSATRTLCSCRCQIRDGRYKTRPLQIQQGQYKRSTAVSSQ